MPGGGSEGRGNHAKKGLSQQGHHAGNQGKRTKPQFVPGEVLVKFKAGVTREEIDATRETYGLSLMNRLKGIGVYRFKIPPGSTVEDMVDTLMKNSQVEYAEPNYTVGIHR
jgi:hypothetical protein